MQIVRGKIQLQTPVSNADFSSMLLGWAGRKLTQVFSGAAGQDIQHLMSTPWGNCLLRRDCIIMVLTNWCDDVSESILLILKISRL
jgi:hypothetical protein